MVVPESAPEIPYVGEEARFARLKLPPNVPRLIPLQDDPHSHVLLEEAHGPHVKRLVAANRREA